MKAAAFDYARAEGLAGALETLSGGDGGLKVMGGGQSLLPMMNLRLAWAERLLDISELAELTRRERVGNRYRIGGAVTHATLEDARDDDPTQGYLPTVAAGIAYRSVRNKGTMAGSVVHADPAGDWPTALRALDTRVLLQGAGGERCLALADFQVGLMETALEEGEIVVGFDLPVLSEHARWAYRKFNRKTGEFGHAICAAVVDPDQDWSAVILGAVVDTPQRLAACSDWLASAAARDAGRAKGLEEAVCTDLEGALDHPSDSYEYHLASTMVRRALLEVIGT